MPEEYRMGLVLQFLQILLGRSRHLITTAIVACERGKHRRVSVGFVLRTFCSLSVDFSRVKDLSRTTCKVCGEMARDRLHDLESEFRLLTPLDARDRLLLSRALNLPS